jgi:hypothetical protein
MTNETSKKDDRIHYLYRITNLINGKVYIGQTVQPDKRWYQHRSDAANPVMIISRAIKKYGANAFEFEIIAGCKTWDDTNDAETLLVQQYNCQVPNGYNVAPGGLNAPKSEEWKQKVSQSLMGHEVTAEARDKISKSHMGLIVPDEVRQKIKIGNTGKEVSEETRQLLSKINMGNTNFKGRHHSEEAKQKLVKAAAGRKPSDIAHQKSVEKTKGNTWKTIDGKRVWIKILSPDQKECSKCHVIKNVLSFSKRTDGGLSSWCKECFNEYRRERRRVNALDEGRKSMEDFEDFKHTT